MQGAIALGEKFPGALQNFCVQNFIVKSTAVTNERTPYFKLLGCSKHALRHCSFPILSKDGSWKNNLQQTQGLDTTHTNTIKKEVI